MVIRVQIATKFFLSESDLGSAVRCLQKCVPVIATASTKQNEWYLKAVPLSDESTAEMSRLADSDPSGCDLHLTPPK